VTFSFVATATLTREAKAVSSRRPRGAGRIADHHQEEDLVRFHSVIRLGGKTATGIPVPEEVVEGLGRGKRPPVRVTINGYTYRTTVAVRGGEFMLPISTENREGAGVAAGDEVDVDVELDAEPREVSVPQDFAEALDRDAEARRFFEGLSYSNKQRYVLPIEQAKAAETRRRRIAKAVSELREGRTYSNKHKG
jgi:hypothetical protein